MKICIKDFAVTMEIKNRGVELEVRDSHGTHLGDLVVTNANLVWCKGRTTHANGTKISWKQFIKMMEER